LSVFNDDSTLFCAAFLATGGSNNPFVQDYSENNYEDNLTHDEDTINHDKGIIKKDDKVRLKRAAKIAAKEKEEDQRDWSTAETFRENNILKRLRGTNSFSI